MEQLFKWLAKLPSTNTRIVVTLACVIATAVRVVALGWSPPIEWLAFLLAMAGVDAAQFTAKRMTHQGETTTNGGAS
jgi:hypothetical protein